MYRLKSWMILGGLIALFALISHLVFDWRIALLVLGFGLIMDRLSSGFGATLILRMHRAQRLSEWEFPYLYRIADRVATLLDLEKPVRRTLPSYRHTGPGYGRGMVA